MSEDVFEVAEFDEWDTTEDVVDKLKEAFIETLEGDDTVLVGGDEEWQNKITADDAAELMKLKKNAPDSVHFASVSKEASNSWSSPKSKTDTGRGVDKGYDSTTVYQITCPKCHGSGEVETTNGWNSYCKCGHCGTYIML
jgi:DnaJ-class molecular chaperone